jgi:ACS family tartrate transporter-like MFS transporter
MWRLMPFLFLLYIVAYLDRINLGFAILQMRGQLNLSDSVFGNAAGIFFFGYLIFQLPSNLILEKVGVRRWICVLMVLWGLVSCGMIFIRGPWSFYGLRFLLGAAEAGFFPGMILYMKNWFPVSARGRAVAWFMTANPLAGLIGSPISGALLGRHGYGLAGWQWLFLVEGLPAIILGIAVLWVLVDSPLRISWLTGEQREWLASELERERVEAANDGREQSNMFNALGRSVLLSLVYFALPACMYGVTFWLPTAVRGLGIGYASTGRFVAIPYIVTAIAMVAVGMSSDRSGERVWHTAGPAFFGGAALALAAYSGSPWLVIVGMSLGMVGAQSMAGPFWAMATSRTTGRAAAAGIAVINSLGNLGGYFGPSIIGFVRSSTGQFRGLMAIGVVMAISAIIALVIGRNAAPPEPA